VATHPLIKPHEECCKPTEVRTVAERAAFTMAADSGLGLSPSRDALSAAMETLEFRVPVTFDRYLDALEFIKLARSDVATAPGSSKVFTFAHRRFQEYFSTTVVLGAPNLVTPRQLLTDARWRETAVVLCQAQPIDQLGPILEECRVVLDQLIAEAPSLIEDPLAFVAQQSASPVIAEHERESAPAPFRWPPASLHLLGLLQDGFSRRLKDVPDDILERSGRIIVTAFERGTQFDRKWAVEVGGIVQRDVLLFLVRRAFASDSQWLRDVAYRQAARLGEVPPDIERGIRSVLVRLAAQGRLRRERHATYAHLTRLSQPGGLLSTLRLLLAMRAVDLAIHLTIWIALVTWSMAQTGAGSLDTLVFIVIVTPLVVVSYIAPYLFDPFNTFLRATNVKSNPVREMVERLLIIPNPMQRASAEMLEIMTWIMLLVYLRLPIIMAALIVRDDTFYGHTMWYIYLYGLLWNPFAWAAASMGRFTRSFWWICIPFLPILLLFHIPTWQSMISWLAENRRALLVWLLYLGQISVITTIFLAGLRYLESLFPERSVWLAFAFALLTICGVLVYAALWIRDWLRWRVHSRQLQSLLTPQAFLDDLVRFGRYVGNRFPIWYVRQVRERGLLAPTDETVHVLTSILIELERRRARGRPARGESHPSSRADSRVPSKAQASASDRQTVKLGTMEYSAELLDELSMLLERVTIARQGVTDDARATANT